MFRGEDADAPANRADRTAMRPIGPQPRTATVAVVISSTKVREDGVAHRLLDRGDLRRQPPRSTSRCVRQAHVLGEGRRRRPRPGFEKDWRRRARAGPALVARPVHEMRFGRRRACPADGAGARACATTRPAHLVAEDARQELAHAALCPRIPAVDVQVGAAQGDPLQGGSTPRRGRGAGREPRAARAGLRPGLHDARIVLGMCRSTEVAAAMAGVGAGLAHCLPPPLFSTKSRRIPGELGCPAIRQSGPVARS